MDAQIIQCEDISVETTADLENKLRELQDQANVILSKAYACWKKDKTWENYCLVVNTLQLKRINPDYCMKNDQADRVSLIKQGSNNGIGEHLAKMKKCSEIIKTD